VEHVIATINDTCSALSIAGTAVHTNVLFGSTSGAVAGELHHGLHRLVTITNSVSKLLCHRLHLVNDPLCLGERGRGCSEGLHRTRAEWGAGGMGGMSGDVVACAHRGLR